MTEIEKENAVMQAKCLVTILKLRDRNFKNDLPFLILNAELPEGQAYYEYHDGRIEIRELIVGEGQYDTQYIRTVSEQEAVKIRLEHGLQ